MRHYCLLGISGNPHYFKASLQIDQKSFSFVFIYQILYFMQQMGQYYILIIAWLFNVNSYVKIKVYKKIVKLLSIKTMMNEKQKETIPTLYMIESMFEENGFKLHSTITKQLLKEIFNKQLAKNSQSFVNSEFDRDVLEQLWSQVEILSDSSVKVQNLCQVIHEAMKILDERLKQLNGPSGIDQKQTQLRQLQKQQEQINKYIQFGYQNQQEQMDLNSIRKQISRLNALIIQLKYDEKTFSDQLSLLKLTVQSQKTQQKSMIINQTVKKVGYQPRIKSEKLQWIFNFTVISFCLELIIIIYRVSFLSLLAYCLVFYLLFLGYYNDNTAKYILVAIIVSIIFDQVFIVLTIFTSMAIAPQMYSGNNFMKIVIMILIILTTITRVLIIKNLLSYLNIPKNKEYFNFWGEQVILNKRSKNLLKSQRSSFNLNQKQLQRSEYIQVPLNER